MIFEPGDWVLLYLREERFPKQRQSKLSPNGYGPFRVLQQVNDNAYLQVGVTRGIQCWFDSDLSPFLDQDDPDLRTNPFQVEGTDVCTDDILESRRIGNEQVVRVPLGPVTRARAKRFKESLALVRSVQDQQGVH